MVQGWLCPCWQMPRALEMKQYVSMRWWGLSRCALGLGRGSKTKLLLQVLSAPSEDRVNPASLPAL